MKKHINLTFITSMIFTTVFLFAIMFGSLKHYIYSNTLEKNGNYHVRISTDNFKYYDMNYIKRLKKISNNYEIVFNNINIIHTQTNKICRKINCINIKYNDKLLTLNNTFNTMSSPFIKKLILGIIIFFILYLLILKNSFGVCFYKKIKEFAIMNSLGMNKLDMFIYLFKKYTNIFIISLFISIILSILLSYASMEAVKQLLEINNFHLYYDIQYLLLAFISVLLIFYISLFVPINKIKKNIVRVINNENNIKYKKVKLKANVINSLAYINYKRNKKKSRLFILTVFTSITLFVLINVSISYIDDAVKGYVHVLKYDAIIKTKHKENSLSILNDYLKFDKNVEKYSLFRMCMKTINVPKNNYVNKKYYEENKNILFIGSDKDKVINKVPTSEKYKIEYKKYLKKFTIDNKKLQLSNNIPFGIDNFLSSSNIVVLKKDLNKWCSNYETVLILKGDKINIKQNIKKLKSKNKDVSFEYINYAKPKKLLNNIILFVRIITFIFAGLILIVGMTSFINGLYSNIAIQKREIKILKSLGMSTEDIQKMVFKENILVLFKSSILAIIITTVLNNYLYKTLIKYFNVKWHNSILLNLIYLLIIFALMYINLCKIYNITEDD